MGSEREKERATEKERVPEKGKEKVKLP